MPLPSLPRLLAFAAWCVTPALAQANATEFVERVNRLRAQSQGCPGSAAGPVPPLRPQPALDRVAARGTENLKAGLGEAGYPAAHARALGVSGPRDAGSALDALLPKDCALLRDREFQHVGAWQEGQHWRLVLASPLLSEALAPSPSAGREVLTLVNQARSVARSCGGQRFAPARPLAWNDELARAAQAHSDDMARRLRFAHKAWDGSEVGDRARRQGYVWKSIGENIATGQGSPQKVMAGWLDSPGHCRNIMEPGYSEMGAAYSVTPHGETRIYWTQVFGHR